MSVKRYNSAGIVRDAHGLTAEERGLAPMAQNGQNKEGAPGQSHAEIAWETLAARLPGGVAVFGVTPDGRAEQLYLNETFYTLVEAAHGDVPLAALSVLREKERARLLTRLRSAAFKNTHIDMELGVPLRGAHYRWLNVQSSILERDAARVVVCLLFTRVDVSHNARVLGEESHRAIQIASKSGDMALWVYRPDTGNIYQTFSRTARHGYGDVIPDGPEEIIRTGGVHPDDVAAFRAAYTAIDEGAASSECTVRILDHMADKFEWQHITLTRQTDAAGSAPTAIGFATNVELQKEAEIRYERENRLRQELVKDSVIYYRINLSSGIMEELYTEADDPQRFKVPAPMQELIKGGLFDGCYEADRAMVTERLDPGQMLRNYESGKTAESFVYRRALPGKGLRWLKASVAKLKRVSSDDVIAFFTAIDIDDEKKEQILFRDVMNEEIESLITMKLPSKQIRIIKENLDLPGYDPNKSESEYFRPTDAFRAALFRNMLPEELTAASEFLHTARIVDALEKQPILQATYRILEEGTIRRKKLRVFYLDETRCDIVFVRRDITDLYKEQQRQSETIRHAMNEAKLANEAKSVFLSRMSHDMRTPLNAIIGYSGQVLRADATEAQKDEFLDDIHASGEYLLGIINDVLDMTKIESNKMVLHPEPYSCEAFRTSLETVIQPLCRKKGVTFTMNLPAHIESELLLDKIRFNQIFVNILSNAVKFTPAGGRIVLDARCTPGKNRRVNAVFTVSDTGCGMSPEFLPHAFDSFSQEYAGQAMHNEQGTGLGLSIVRQLVELMGGRISVESTLGEGTTFTVKMPLELAQGGQSAAQTIFPQNGLRGRHLLLCEDHPMNRKIAVRLLEKEGCTVEIATDGAEGLAMFCASPQNCFDAVLMDIRMPNMDGLAAARAIRALPREDAQDVPIIAMTANAFVEDHRASVEAGMNAHIAKPIDPMTLYQLIYSLTANRHVTRTPKVLIVDDIEMNAALTARVLQDSYDTLIALDGAQALEMLKHNPYIIAVITDVQMPGMDGGALIRAIRSNHTYDRIALIANTQFGNSHMEEQLMRDGADDFIYKPSAPSLVLSRLQNVLAKYR